MTLVLENLSKAVGAQTHIHTTDLTLEKGTMNVLLGPTLSGKTTLMRLMAGLELPSSEGTALGAWQLSDPALGCGRCPGGWEWKTASPHRQCSTCALQHTLHMLCSQTPTAHSTRPRCSQP